MIFSETVQIHLQGNPALRFLEIRQAPESDLPFVEFQLLGFHQPEIFIQDDRPETLAVIEQIQTTGQADQFSATFNLPAQASFYAAQENRPAILTLSQTEEIFPQLVLWLASEIDDEIPAYEYLYRHASRVAPGRFAFLALFQHVSNSEAPIPFQGEIDTQIELSC